MKSEIGQVKDFSNLKNFMSWRGKSTDEKIQMVEIPIEKILFVFKFYDFYLFIIEDFSPKKTTQNPCFHLIEFMTGKSCHHEFVDNMDENKAKEFTKRAVKKIKGFAKNKGISVEQIFKNQIEKSLSFLAEAKEKKLVTAMTIKEYLKFVKEGK